MAFLILVRGQSWRLMILSRKGQTKMKICSRKGFCFLHRMMQSFHAITSDVLTASKNSLLLNHETSKMIETNSTFSSYLELLNEKHSEGAESIRNLTINCLEKDYMLLIRLIVGFETIHGNY
ncbi:kinesin-like protein KIN-5B [Miscanthus floridulus]|uniref:kinesin-like protein KIN-5B n=1 Tax=Miscanthus floridulus TaxID=154761 RepID=UPI003459D7AA